MRLLINKTREKYDDNKILFNRIILFLISISYVLSDWMIGLFTFTEIFLIFILIILFLIKEVTISGNQMKIIGFITIGILTNSIYHVLFTSGFNPRVFMFAMVKLIFYLLITVILYNYIKINKGVKFFLLMNNFIATIIGVLAIYIALAVYAEVYLNINIPYENLLHFTRVDGHLFRANIPIVRMKSIFKEPAHLGFYLNTILLVNLHNKIDIKVPILFNIFISIIILLTFSYSSVAIMMFILILKLISNIKILKNKLKTKYTFVVMALIALLIIIFRDELYITFISRTIELITGNESSGYERIVLSWRFLNRNNFITGIGLMQTPGSIWSIPAYIMTELGLMGIIVYVAFSIYLISLNTSMGLVFIILNFAKGGYLSSSFWFLILMMLIYISNKKRVDINASHIDG